MVASGADWRSVLVAVVEVEEEGGELKGARER